MMIVVKHLKVGDLSYVSHKDVVSAMHRGLKRMKIDVNYSQGYVPHMLTYSTTPIPLGTQSLCEYFVVDCNNVDADRFVDLYNANMPDGIRCLYAIQKDKNPNLAAVVVASLYEIESNNEISKDILNILNEKEYVINMKKKGEIIQKDVRPLIYDIQIDNNKLYLKLASGSVNLRVDSFVNHLNEKYNLNVTANSIIKIKQYVQNNDKLEDVEDFLK